MPSPLRVSTPGWVAEFKAFIMRGNVVDLAVGIIIHVEGSIGTDRPPKRRAR